MPTTIECYEKLQLINPLEPVDPKEQDMRDMRGLLDATPENIDAQYRKLILLNHPELKPIVPQVVNKTIVTKKKEQSWFGPEVEVEIVNEEPTVISIVGNHDPYALLEEVLNSPTAQQKSVSIPQPIPAFSAEQLEEAELEKRKEEFEEIHRAYKKLKNHKYKCDYPEAGFLKIEKPALVQWLLQGHLKREEYEEQQERIKQRNSERQKALEKASFFEKTRAAAAGLLYGLAILTIGLVVTAVVLTMILLSVFAVWVAPDLVPNIIKKKVSKVLSDRQKAGKEEVLGDNQKENKEALGGKEAKRLATRFAFFLILASPFIGFLLVGGWLYGSVKNGYKAYQEIAARGMNDHQKTALAMTAFAITGVLSVAFPLAGLVAAAGALVVGMIYGVSQIFKKCTAPKYTYPSLQELAKKGLYAPPEMPPAVMSPSQVAENDLDGVEQKSQASQQHASNAKAQPRLPLSGESTKNVLDKLKHNQKSLSLPCPLPRVRGAVIVEIKGTVGLAQAVKLCEEAQRKIQVVDAEDDFFDESHEAAVASRPGVRHGQ